MPYLTNFCPLSGGSCCVKNGPNLLKINIFCMFWPNNVWKPFCIKLFYETFLVYQIFNIFNYIVLWNMFSQAHFQHFIAIVPYFGPFQGVMLCKNGPKILKINNSWIFWPNIVWMKAFWSRGILETYGFTLVRPSVRPYVRTYVRTDFLRNPRIRFFWFFSWTCDSVTVK